MPGLAQCGHCKAWFDTLAGHRCGFPEDQNLDAWKAGPVRPSGTLPLVDTGKITDLLKDHEVARLRAQLDEAVGLLRRSKDHLPMSALDDSEEVEHDVEAFLNRLDAGECGE